MSSSPVRDVDVFTKGTLHGDLLRANHLFPEVVDVSNLKLLTGILIASVPDIITLVVQTVTYPLTVDPSVRNSECSAPHADVFLALYAAWKILWLAVGAWASYAVRTVPKKYARICHACECVTF